MTTQSIHGLATEFVKLDDMIRELEATAKTLRKKKERLGEDLMGRMVDEGAPSLEVWSEQGGGKVRVYPTSKLYARRDAEATETEFEQAIQESGYGDLIKRTVNTNSLSAVVREVAESAGVRESGPAVIKEALHPSLAKVLAINTTPTLAIRRK